MLSTHCDTTVKARRKKLLVQRQTMFCDCRRQMSGIDNHTSGVFAKSPAQPIDIKIGVGCPVADVINSAKFQLDRFRGFRATDGRKSLTPIDLRYHPDSSYALTCYTVILGL